MLTSALQMFKCKHTTKLQKITTFG